MDLTPRPTPETPKPRRRLLPAIIAGVAVVAGIVIVGFFLTSSIDYYCNVDEIGVREGCDDTRRVRVQGSVDEGSLSARGSITSFVMSFNGKTLPVDYEGEPGGIFQECIPVVAHGRIVDGVLVATRIEVKHSNEYEAENSDRIAKAETSACS
jgi:cytochrome c-type biogenesis protein CcmE